MDLQKRQRGVNSGSKLEKEGTVRELSKGGKNFKTGERAEKSNATEE